MKKILILADFYYPKPLANGICVHQVALSLKEKEYEVHVLCFGKVTKMNFGEIDGIHVHKVKQRLFYTLREHGENNPLSISGKISYKFAMLINKFKKIALFNIYPLTSLHFLMRYHNMAKKLHHHNEFKTVVSVFNPLEALISGTILKEKNPAINYVVYTLDSLTNGAKRRFIPRKWTMKKGWKWEQKAYSAADLILNMNTHKKHHRESKYDRFQFKMEFVDIPLLQNKYPQKAMKKFKNTSNGVTLLYSGGLSLQGRNPQYLCELILEMNKINDFSLDFYSRGNCENLIRDYAIKSNSKIKQFGYVDRSVIIEAMESVDVLISIGNKGSQMIPSKIFEYMSTGKKIIHLYTESNDSSLVYYKEYPNALLIDENDDFNDNLNKVLAFLESEKKELSFEDLKMKFESNLPEFTSGKIDFITNRKLDT